MVVSMSLWYTTADRPSSEVPGEHLVPVGPRSEGVLVDVVVRVAEEVSPDGPVGEADPNDAVVEDRPATHGTTVVDQERDPEPTHGATDGALHVVGVHPVEAGLHVAVVDPEPGIATPVGLQDPAHGLGGLDVEGGPAREDLVGDLLPTRRVVGEGGKGLGVGGGAHVEYLTPPPTTCQAAGSIDRIRRIPSS